LKNNLNEIIPEIDGNPVKTVKVGGDVDIPTTCNAVEFLSPGNC
jgi:hypothetical protein